MKTKSSSILFAIASLVFSAEARLELGSPFVDHAVLQRGKPVRIWGWADAGANVRVAFAGQEKSAVAAADGRWLVTLDPMPASKESRTLRVFTVDNDRRSIVSNQTIKQSNNQTILTDILVGEVWLCSGQSNMEFSLCSGAARVRERDGSLTAQMTERPFIRYLNGSAYQASARPLSKTRTRRYWEKLTPGMLKRHGISAIGVLYALELYAALEVPVGIIAAAWGGTAIAPWTPREGFAGKPELADLLAKIPAADAKGDRVIAGCPTAIHNALVAPLAPYAMRGIVWYQGESDRRDGKRYALKMKAYFDGLRRVFGDRSLKLYFCQIAPWKFGGDGYFDVRTQQAKFAAEEPNAEMVVTADLGNADEIHPYEKAPVAKRLAAYALRNDYGWKTLACDYPRPVSATATGAVVCVRFEHGKDLALYNLTGRNDLNVEVAGPDGAYRPAQLVETPRAPLYLLPGGELRVRAEGVAEPRRVRYLFDSAAFGAIVNGTGLPAGPFELEVADSLSPARRKPTEAVK